MAALRLTKYDLGYTSPNKIDLGSPTEFARGTVPMFVIFGVS
jgi:hypothetical protein